MKVVWTYWRPMNTGGSHLHSTPSMPPSSAPFSSHWVFLGFKSTLVVLTLDFLYLHMSFLCLFPSLPSPDWLLYIPKGPFKCHIFRAALPAAPTGISLCACVLCVQISVTQTVWRLHAKVFGQSSCHISELNIYQVDEGGGRASQTGNWIYTTGYSNEECRMMIPWVHV